MGDRKWENEDGKKENGRWEVTEWGMGSGRMRDEKGENGGWEVGELGWEVRELGWEMGEWGW